MGSPFDRLPDEVIVSCLLPYMSPRDVVLWGATETRLHALASDPPLWLRICARGLRSPSTVEAMRHPAANDWRRFYVDRVALEPTPTDIRGVVQTMERLEVHDAIILGEVGRRGRMKKSLLRVFQGRSDQARPQETAFGVRIQDGRHGTAFERDPSSASDVVIACKDSDPMVRCNVWSHVGFDRVGWTLSDFMYWMNRMKFGEALCLFRSERSRVYALTE